MQNIHFDLNTTNFLVDTKDRIRLMDYDNVQLGNIYTDIGFAFQRLIIPYIESGEQDIVKLIHTCIDSYKKGNLGFEPDPYKIAIAMVNRALRNVRASLDLKYQDNDTQWLNSIELNIERLKQACEISKVIQENVKRN